MSDAWAPTPKLKTWQWAEENVVLPPTSPRPGRYSTDLVSYVHEVFDAYDDPRTEIIVLVWGTQTTKTTVMQVMLMHTIAVDPANSIWLMPNKDLSESFAKTRFQPMAEATPCVAAKLPIERSKNLVDEKIMDSMILNFIGSNSATNLSSRSAAKLFIDEADKMEQSLSKEACPIELLRERQRWFRGRKKTIIGSTPVTTDRKIWPWLERGTHEKLFWPCPHCEKMFCPEWKHMKWNHADGLSNEQKASSAWLACPHCEGRFFDQHKRRALAAAKWVATNPGQKRIRSFHLSEMQTQLSTFYDLVLYFLGAVEDARKGDPGKLQNFVNSKLAEPWEGHFGRKREVSELDVLQDGRKRGVVPDRAVALVAGIDTQHEGFWYLVRAHGQGGESWLVQEGFVKDFADLDQVIFGVSPDGAQGYAFYDQSGRGRDVTLALIDSQGHRMDEVHAWCERRGPHLVHPIIGRRTMETPFKFRPIEEKGFGGMQRVYLNTTFYKDVLSHKLQINAADPGAFHLHDATSAHYKSHMMAEYRDPTGVWVCPKHVDNHLFDCEGYAWAAATIRGVWDWSHPFDFDPEEGPTPPPSYQPQEAKIW